MGYPMQPITSTASALTLDRDVHSGNTLVIDRAAGWTITLPASSGDGDEYEIFVGTTVTANGVIQVANSTDVINGGVSISTDIAGVTFLAAATDDTITMNGSTTGGLQGSFVKLKDVKSGFWRVEGFLASSGSEADCFSAAV